MSYLVVHSHLFVLAVGWFEKQYSLHLVGSLPAEFLLGNYFLCYLRWSHTVNNFAECVIYTFVWLQRGVTLLILTWLPIVYVHTGSSKNQMDMFLENTDGAHCFSYW